MQQKQESNIKENIKKNNKSGLFVPLDGKTNINSTKINSLTENLYHEIKLAIEKNYQTQWNIHKDKIIHEIAVLLVDDSEQIDDMEAELKQRLSTRPTKKGRPKKKDNPWQYVIDSL